MNFFKHAVVMSLVFSISLSASAQNRVVNPGNFLDGKVSPVASKEYSRLKTALERSIEIKKSNGLITFQFIDKLRSQKLNLSLSVSQMDRMNPLWRRMATGAAVIPFVIAGVAGFSAGAFVAAGTVFWYSAGLTGILGTLGAGLALGGIFVKLETMIDPLNPGHQWERARIEKEIKTAFGKAESVNVLIGPRSIDEYDDYLKHIQDLISDLK